jgi:hypothetical protein
MPRKMPPFAEFPRFCLNNGQVQVPSAGIDISGETSGAGAEVGEVEYIYGGSGGGEYKCEGNLSNKP